MTKYILSATGPDRAGLVAVLTKILFQEGCNLEDSTMTRLQGQFAILLIFTGPDSSQKLTESLLTVSKETGLITHLIPVVEKKSVPPATVNGLLVTVYGADRPGIVHRTTERLALSNVNITNLKTHRTTTKSKSGYILYVEGEAPRSLPLPRLEKNLRSRLGSGVTVHVRALAVSAL